MENKNVIEFYDNRISKQFESGVNDRIYQLYQRLLHLGLKSDSNVLELGSGIGVMTFLLSRYIKKGKIEAVDISPELVKFSRQRIKNDNITFFANDIVNHQPLLQKIDFVTLFDVLEHIPVERHDKLFNKIATMCNEDTKLLINIPNPDYIEYDSKYHPDELQIIDQPLPLKVILENLEKNGLTISFFETYSVWVENDYQFFVVTKKKPFKEIRLSNKRNFLQKVIIKAKRTYIKLRHDYH